MLLCKYRKNELRNTHPPVKTLFKVCTKLDGAPGNGAWTHTALIYKATAASRFPLPASSSAS